MGLLSVGAAHAERGCEHGDIGKGFQQLPVTGIGKQSRRIQPGIRLCPGKGAGVYGFKPSFIKIDHHSDTHGMWKRLAGADYSAAFFAMHWRMRSTVRSSSPVMTCNWLSRVPDSFSILCRARKSRCGLTRPRSIHIFHTLRTIGNQRNMGPSGDQRCTQSNTCTGLPVVQASASSEALSAVTINRSARAR